MKKLFLTSAMIGMFVLPTYATTVTGTGTECTEPVLNTDTGPATLQAQWDANTINLNWYSDDTQITVPTASNTCTYDGGITLPTTNPTKEGYTFGGWQVRVAQQCSLSGLDTSVSGTGYGYQNDSTGQYGASSSNTTKYGITQDQTWATEFSYGIVKGVALCSTTSGTRATAGTPDESGTGSKCWCKGTGLAETNSSEYCPVASSSWVFRYDYDYGSASDCAGDCARGCADAVQYDSGFRRGVYGQ